MLKYANYDIVFQEVPDEVTLAINISNCPNQCVGCHSKYLWKDVGYILDKDSLDQLIDEYQTGITCVCFMGGDNDPYDVANLAMHVKNKYNTIKPLGTQAETSSPKLFMPRLSTISKPVVTMKN